MIIYSIRINYLLLYFICLQFDKEKIGDDKITIEFYENFKSDLENLSKKIMEMWTLYDQCVCNYSDSMQRWISRAGEHPTESDLMNYHCEIKNAKLTQVLNQNY